MPYYFNLPALNELTLNQRSALNEQSAIALQGGPGTGKSVVSLYRHITNHQNHRSSLLLTYTTTLKLYLAACCRGQSVQAAGSVGTTYKKTYPWGDGGAPHYGEIIIDEAQDVDMDRYRIIKSHADRVSYGADESQSLFDNGSTCAELRGLFPNNVPKRLERNFRNTRRILQFCQTCFRQANISMQDIMSCRALGELPQLFVTEDRIFGGQDSQQDEAIKEIIRDNQGPTHNIAILCPWGKTVDYFYNLIKDDFEDVTFYYRQGNQERGCEELGNIHVTTFKSAKGLEFDTVIIPNFQNVDEDLERFHINWKDFYVGVTRSRTNLYLISDSSCSMVNSQYVETIEL